VLSCASSRPSLPLGWERTREPRVVLLLNAGGGVQALYGAGGIRSFSYTGSAVRFTLGWFTGKTRL
jgi:hypothetical protein